MRIPYASTVLLCLLLASCASMQAAPARIPAKDELIGEFAMGDGLGVCMELELRHDGTYKATFCGGGHIGLSSSYTYGLWQVKENHIFFYDNHGTYNAPNAEFTYAETFYYKDLPAFVLAQDLRSGRPFEAFVFKKQND